MSDDSSSSSLLSDARSRLVVDPRVERLKAILTKETEAFALKLLRPVRKFIIKTTTTADQLRAMTRCLRRCIESFNFSLVQEGFELDVLEDDKVAEPVAEKYTKDHALDLVKHLTSHTLEFYLTTLDPPPTTITDDALCVLKIIREDVRECDKLIDSVEGYDGRDESEGDESEDFSDEE